jgi:F-type H+-transporting ATPase subunit a
VSTTLLAVEGGEGFVSPGPGTFVYPPLFGEGTFFTKPMLITVLGSLAVAVFFYVASRRAAMVPGKAQFAGESAYGFVRNSIAMDAIGKEGMKYVPYLATVFFFLAALNISGIIPFLQFPATSRIGIPLFLAVISCVIFNAIGIKRHGLVGYFKDLMFPPGIPWPVYILLAPIEFVSTIIIRPLTLTLRLTFNMFAGHLVLVLFILGGEYLVLEYGGFVGILSGSVALIGSLVLTAFEGFVQLLQAYVFTLLSALYIGGALADEH